MHRTPSPMCRMRRRAVSIAAGVAVIVLAGTATGAPAPAAASHEAASPAAPDAMSLLYVNDDAVRAILGGSPAMQGLPWLFRQEPSTSGPGTALGAGNTQRMVKVGAADLAAQQTGAGMAAVLREAVNRTCTTPAGVSTCGAHRVIVDELDSRFGGRNGAASPEGSRLQEAMATLSREQAPWGGTYASRVHFALAPGPATSVTAGYGPDRALGRNGVPIRRNYRAAFGALAMSGGVWIQMYHYSPGAGITGYTPAEWRDVPVGVASFLGAANPAREPLTYMHVLMSDGPTSCVVLPWRNRTRFPAYGRARVSARARIDARVARRAAAMITETGSGATQAAAAGSPMDCQWAQAQSGAVNARILMNGPGAYSLDVDQASAWGRQFRQFFRIP